MVEDFSCIVHWRFEIENGIRTSETLRGFFRGKRGNDNSRASITRVTVEKYYSIGEFFTCVQKKPVHVFEMQFNGEWERKKGMCYARVKKKDAIAERDDDYYPFRSSVDSARFLLDSGGGGNPRSKSFSNRYVFSHLPWKDIMRFHEEYKSYEIYCRTSLCLSTSVSTFWRLGIKKNRTINCIF